MQKYIIIGLGNFGMNLGITLEENGCEVLGLDMDRVQIQKAKDILTQTIIGDATNRNVLEALPIRDFDGAIVSIGQELAASILISLYLKELGIERIIVRAISEDHAKILRLQGVSDIIFPERDMAVRIGTLLSMKNVVDYLPLSKDYAIMDVTPPARWIGKSIRDLQIGAKYSCQILGIKYNQDTNTLPDSTRMDTGNTKIAPSAGDIIPSGSLLIVLGRQRDIDRLQRSE